MFLKTSLDESSFANRLANFDNEDVEVRRLKHLFEENILKVERENMEIIKKKMTEEKLCFEERDTKTSTETKLNKVIKSSISTSGKKRLVCSKPQKIKTDSRSKLQCLNSDKLSQENVRTDCKFSTIHFLNDFQASLLSSKVKAQNYESEKYFPCAVPLAPPTQTSSVQVGKIYSSSSDKNTICSNAVLHHIKPKVVPKNLSIQVLPSITINETTRKWNKNILNEELRKMDYFEGDGIKTTVLPAVSDEEKTRLSKIKLNSLNHKKLSFDKRNNSTNSVQPCESVSTQTYESSIVSKIADEKEQLKDIFKEVLQNFTFSSEKNPKECSDVMADEVSDILCPVNDCALDSFLGNVQTSQRDETSNIDERLPKCIASTQTNCISQDLSADILTREQVQLMIQDMMSEWQNNVDQISSANKEKTDNLTEKRHKEIQTVVATCEKGTQDDYSVSTPKATQVCFEENESVKCDNAVKTPLKNYIEKDPTENTTFNHSIDLSDKPNELSRLQTVVDSIYEELCERRVSHSQDFTPAVSSDNFPVHTREVSVQFNPISTLTKGTCTSNVQRVDASEQCSLLSVIRELEKEVRNVQVQAEIIVPEPKPGPPSQTNDICVQCDKPAFIDSVTQTVECLTVPTELSANTSVSSTPVSDSMFLDDMLSEGEVFLPCNLRLSGSVKTAAQGSRNETDMSGGSDKDQDYSLSEGEIHPKYLQEINMQKSSTESSYIGSSTLPTPSKFFRSSGRICPESNFQSVPERSCYSSSSLSEGEIRCCSTPLSEGDILPPAWQSIPRPSSLSDTNNSMSYGPWSALLRYPISSQSHSSFQSDTRVHYHLSAANEDLIRDVAAMSLDDVSEEK